MKFAKQHLSGHSGLPGQNLNTRPFILIQFSALLLFLLIISSCNEMEKETSRHNEKSVLVKDSSYTIDAGKEIVESGAGDTAGLTQAEQKIANIRRQFNLINSQQLRRQSFGFECDAKDTIHYYSDRGEIVKIVIDWGFVGDGKSRHEYYYKNNTVFFVYKKHMGYVPGKGEKIFEQRSYFDADKNIRYVEDQTLTGCVDCSLGQNSREYKALAAFKTKDFKAALCDL
jgi:hypothetical protein